MAKKDKNESDTITDGSPEHAHEEFEIDEPTPASSQVRLPESMYVAIKIMVATKQMYMRDFYADAFSEFVRKRKNWNADKDGEFIYRATPKDAKVVTMAVFEQHFEEIDKLADKDNVRRRTAYFNAIYDHVQKLSEEIDL